MYSLYKKIKNLKLMESLSKIIKTDSDKGDGEMEMEKLKVATNSNANSLAGAIAALIKEDKLVELHSVGAGALNQAVKGVAVSRGFLAPMGIDIIVSPAFVEVEINGETRTAIKLVVEKRGM